LARAGALVSGAPHSFAFADLWEAVSASVPSHTALVCGEHRLSFSELDDRAGRLAGWLAERGVGTGTYVGVQMRNRVEHVEAMLAGYKLRAIPVNINYRLGPTELRYLYGDCGLVGVVHDEELRAEVAAAVRGLPNVRWTLAVGEAYDSALTTAPLHPIARSSDDLYALYTGGTTGSPKAVEWRMEDAFFACLGGGDPTAERSPVAAPAELLERILAGRAFLPAAPLVHAAGMWTTLRWLLAGCKVVLLPRFAPGEIWEQIARERVTNMNIVGDAMARPLLEALPAASASLNLTCLQTIVSGGSPLSPEVRERLLAALPHLTIKDTYGASETGSHGSALHSAAARASGAGWATGFTAVDTVLLDPITHRHLPPGSDQPGLVARRGRVPLRYHGDAVKSAATFLIIAGQRYALTGDLAVIRPDGTLQLLGRQSQCINSGGEKIYPEEVEHALRDHPDVGDAVVVGVADCRWGQRVIAVVAARAGFSLSEEGLRSHCRGRLAGYKVPKRVLLVAAVQRTVAGKLDYRWAKQVAAEELARVEAGAG
jgi:acyl-CoA synthetase (AMP-forming)/AMP-acid ligase II